MENKSNIKFRLHNIKTEQFAIVEDAYENSDKIQLGLNYRFGSKGEERIIAVLTNFKFKTNKGVLLLIEVSCLYVIDEASWETIYKPEINELQIPKEFATHLLVLTIGTTRGVLHSKTEGTPFNKFFIPTLNVSENIKEDIVIKVEP